MQQQRLKRIIQRSYWVMPRNPAPGADYLSRSASPLERAFSQAHQTFVHRVAPAAGAPVVQWGVAPTAP